MNRCDKRLAYLTGEIIQTHTKEHEQKEILELGSKILFIKAAYEIGEAWSENTTYAEGQRHHTVGTNWATVLNIYLGKGDTLAGAIKFIAGHPLRKNFKLANKDDPENLPEFKEHYEIVWRSHDNEWEYHKRLEIQIHFDTKAECKMVPTGDSIPVMKMVCNGNSSEAAEMLKETESVD